MDEILNSISLLLVDEDEAALEELEEILRFFGYRNIRKCLNGSSAWSMLRVKEADCIIASWDMSEMSGLALLKIVRSDDDHYNTPFFLVHSAFTKMLVIQAGQAGVTGLIVHPYDAKNLEAKIASLSEIEAESAVTDVEETLEEGLALIESGNYKGALSLFNKMTEEGETAELYYNIGYIKTVQGLYPEALSAFRKATQLDRLFAKAYEAMGRVYRKLGQPEKAEQYLQKAADIYMGKDKDKDAEAVLNEILQISTDSINVYNSLGVLYRRKGDLETSLKHYKKALRVHPKAPHIHYNIGRLHIDMGDVESAAHFFNKALNIDPNFKEAREVLDAIKTGSL